MLTQEIRKSLDIADLNQLKCDLNCLQPVDVGEYITQLPEKQRAIAFRLLNKDQAIDVFEYLPTEVQEDLINSLHDAQVVDLVEEMSPDERAYLFDELPAGVVKRLLQQLSPEQRQATATILESPGVQEVIKIMTPATISSGMMPINVATDLYFASPIVGAAAGFNYANLLVQTPLGIISNIILLPLLPTFAKLSHPDNWEELKLRIRQGLLLTAVTMLPLGALMVSLSVPIVQIVYQRGAFKQEATQLVSSLLIAYGIGMFVYLGRDVLVRVFYALGDGQTPFKISIFNIVLNAVLDLILVEPFGAPGLVLATVGVNCSSMLMLLFLLNRKLNGLPWQEWCLPILGLTVGSIIAGLASFGTLVASRQVLGKPDLISLLIELSISAFVGIGVFAIIASRMNIPEVNIFVIKMQQKFLKKNIR